jgi:hypothetical protein
VANNQWPLKSQSEEKDKTLNNIKEEEWTECYREPWCNSRRHSAEKGKEGNKSKEKDLITIKESEKLLHELKM